MQIEIKSSAFDEGGIIPKKYTCDGADVSPTLSWTSVPEETKTIALICDDPDAPMGTWVHWVLFNLPADVKELPENVPSEKNLDNGTMQGTNDFGKIGYGGPCPPDREHRYIFKLFALDAELELAEGSTKAEVEQAIQGHIIAQAELMGKYERQ